LSANHPEKLNDEDKAVLENILSNELVQDEEEQE
jgi:hypothetical protein